MRAIGARVVSVYPLSAGPWDVIGDIRAERRECIDGGGDWWW